MPRPFLSFALYKSDGWMGGDKVSCLPDSFSQFTSLLRFYNNTFQRNAVKGDPRANDPEVQMTRKGVQGTNPASWRMWKANDPWGMFAR